MQANPVSMTMCLLILGSGTLLFSAGAGAIPGNPGRPFVSSGPSPDLPRADPLPDGHEKSLVDQAGSTAESSVLAVELDITSPATDPGENAPRFSIPCLHSSFDETPLDHNTEENPCIAPPDGNQRFSVQFGSRIGTDSSMLGEFDGMRVDYRFTNGLTLNGVAGYPVLSSKDKFNTARRIYGINATTGKFSRAWDLNSYLIEQQENGQVTRRSVGGAVRYLQPRRSLLAFIDYDVFANSLSSFMTSGAWKLPYRTTLSATLDIRNNGIRKHQKKYLQQTMDGNEGWKWILPDKRIEHFTRNRSNKVATLALGLSHAFSQRIKLRGDVAMMDISIAAAADDSTASAPRLSEYFYHLTLSGRDIMIAGDKNILDLRHRVTSSSRISSVSIDTDYAINRLCSISPRLRADYRNNKPDKSVQWVLSPAVKMEYRWRKRHGLDIQAAGEWSAREDADGNETRSSYSVSLGYKANF